LFKELKLLCFDEDYAGSRGLPVVPLDTVLMGLVATVTILGLQAVGLILMIALLVIPAAAARFWTERMTRMTLLASMLGAVSSMVGAVVSAIFPKLPSGAMIVLVAAMFFTVSLVFGPARGVLTRWIRRLRLNARIDRQHLLRAIYERIEIQGGVLPGQPTPPVPFATLLMMRSWTPGRLRRQIRRAQAEELVTIDHGGGVRLTPRGLSEAARLTHDHRLWELYLIRYADIAPGKVDRDADAIEHVLAPELIDELEAMLKLRTRIPRSPHPIEVPEAARSS
jgi:manganese/zinc/iron transport system permease protein